jgi:hypothetical protein
VDDAGQTSNLPIAHALIDPRIVPGVLPCDFNDNGQVEQADLDLVLLHWGQDGAGTPPNWTGPPATGLVDQEELDAVLLNWGAANIAVSAAPVQAPLLAATVDTTPHAAKVTDAAIANLFVGKRPAKSPYRLLTEHLDKVLGDDSSPSTEYVLPAPAAARAGTWSLPT